MLFQLACTGYEVIFDALAVTFAISRRRMVVPIHKKWEAGYTRIQVVKQEEKLQLLAFFEDFHHGHCMNFVLKGTDVYEASSEVTNRVSSSWTPNSLYRVCLRTRKVTMTIWRLFV